MTIPLNGPVGENLPSESVPRTVFPMSNKATGVIHMGVIGPIVVDQDSRTVLFVSVELSQKGCSSVSVDALAAFEAVLVEFADIGRAGATKALSPMIALEGCCD